MNLNSSLGRDTSPDFLATSSSKGTMPFDHQITRSPDHSITISPDIFHTATVAAAATAAAATATSTRKSSSFHFSLITRSLNHPITRSSHCHIATFSHSHIATLSHYHINPTMKDQLTFSAAPARHASSSSGFFSSLLTSKTPLEILLVLLFLVGGVSKSWGQLLQWNTFLNLGTETTEPSVFNATGIGAVNLTLGSVTPAANANRFGGSNWFDSGDTNPTTLAESVSGNDYIEFIVTPTSGNVFTPTSFVFSWDHSSTGPGSVTLRSSVDAFASDLGSVTGMAASLTTGNTILISGLTNLSTAITFRLFGYGATATGGTGGFDAAASGVNVQLNGTTSTCTVGTWTGALNTNWNNAGNWCGGSVPTATTDVVIPFGSPVISAAAVCRNMNITGMATLSISGSNTLTVEGSWNPSVGTFLPGTGLVKFNKASGTQFITPSTSTFYDLEHSGGGTMNVSGNPLNVTNSLNLSAGTLELQAVNVTAGELKGSGAISTNGGAPNITVGSNGLNTTYSGIISQAGGTISFVKNGAGSLALSGSNSYSGTTTINGGILSCNTLANGGSLSSIGSSSNAASNLVFTGGTLAYTGSDVTIDRNFTMNLFAFPNIDIAAGTTLTISGGGTGGGSFNKTGAGTLELTGSNTYTGPTFISVGKLKLNRPGGATIPSTSSVTMTGSSTLQVSTDQTLSNLTLGSGVNLIVDLGATLTITGILNQSGGNISGAGTIAYGPVGKLTYGGNAPQTAGAEFPPVNGPLTLEIQNSAGAIVSLPFSRTIGGLLMMTTGHLALGNNDLTVGSFNGGTLASHVITNGTGHLRATVPLATNYTFPIGTSAGSFDPVQINPSVTSVQYGANVKLTASAGDFTPAINNFALAAPRQWDVNAPGAGTTTVKFTDGNATVLSPPFVVGHSNLISWQEFPAISHVGNTWEWSTSTFSPFGVGSVGAFVPPCVNPDVPTASATPSTICNGSSTTLMISSGMLNSATDWQWYTVSCGGTSAGSGTSIMVSPTVTTTYYVRGEGGCVTPGLCGSVTVTVDQAPSFTTCPMNISTNTETGVCNATVTYTATASGSPAPTVTYVFTGVTTGSGNGTGSGSTFEKGVTNISITASNSCAPDATCSFTITVDDNLAPTLVCPGDVTINTTCTGTFSIPDPITDNCPGSTWGYSMTGANTLSMSGIADGTGSGPLSLNPGVTNVTLSGTDGTNNAMSCTTQVTVRVPEINVRSGMSGNENIVDGDVTPSLMDFTDFGSVNVGNFLTHGHIIDNLGSGTLNINSVTITGPDASQFSIQGVTPASLPGGNVYSVPVRFTPTSNGLKSATVHINTDDCDESDYDYAIQGTGISVCINVKNTDTNVDYCLLQDAINAAMPGEHLLLLNNITEDIISVNKNLTIDGDGYTLTSTSATYGINVFAAGVSMIDLTLQNAGTYGIQVDCGSDNLILTNVTVNNSGGTGITLNGSDNCILTNITSTNNGGNGINITNCDNTTINGLTTSGNEFSPGGFGAGIGIFTSSVYCLPASVNGITVTGTISIGESTKAYSQKASAADPITGLNGAMFAWAVGIGATDRFYWPDKATSYAVVDVLFEAPYNYPNTSIYVVNVGTENFYVDDDPAGDPSPPMLIQTAVNLQAPNQIIFVEPGTYNENVNVTKALSLRGANYNVNCSSGRGAESIITGSGGPGSSAVVIGADNISVNGFTITNTLGTYGVSSSGMNSTDIQYNIITDIGDNVNGQFSSYGVGIAVASANIATVNVSNNCINNIRGGQNPGNVNPGSGVAIGILPAAADFDITGVTITNNLISNITAKTAAFGSGGRGAYGVLINVGASGAHAGKAVGSLVQNNEITVLDGLWAHGVGLEGETPGAMVLNNYIDDLTGHIGSADANGVKLEDNAGSASVQIHDNSFTNMFYGILNATVPVVDATCNWYGLTGAGVAAKISGNVNYNPFLSNGTDNSGARGFQPVPNSCNGCVTGNVVQNINTGNFYCSIQDAINDPATVNGNTIEVHAGVYDEVGQIVISKNLTITGTGMGCGDVEIHPTANTGNIGDARGWWLVPEGVVLNLNNLTLDGNGFLIYQAIRDRGVGTFDHICFKNMLYNPSTDYLGTAVVAFGSAPGSNVDITNSTFTNMGREGVLYYGTGVTGSDFTGNTYTGKGLGDFLDYAVEIGAGAVVNIQNNIISGNRGTATLDLSTSAGILATTYYGTGTAATITNNFINNNIDGIDVGYDAADVSVVEAHDNDLSGNTNLAIFSSAPAVDATCNWFGSTTPATVAAQNSGPVSYTPWLTSGVDLGGMMADGFQPSVACSAPCNLMVSTSSTPAGCPPAADGTATVTVVTGGSGSYSYAWNTMPVQTTATATGLASGMYTVTVTDANGCTATSVATLGTSMSGGPVHNLDLVQNYCTIQAAIDAANPGNEILIDAGTYYENVTVTKTLEIHGASQAGTIVRPALSDPTGGSLGSAVFLVQANNVLIHDLTVNGMNDNITGTGDVDASTGIITDWSTGDWSGLEVHHVTVKDVYLRGIEAANDAAATNTFNFHDNTIDGVQGDLSSIAIFNYGDAGPISNNTITNCTGGIQTNYSFGSIISGNTVTINALGTGIESDNNGGAGGGSVPDVITGNMVTAGAYGMIIYQPYLVVDINNNTISGSTSAGIYVLGSLGGGSANIHNNDATITGAVIGVDIDGSTAGLFQNNIYANGTGVRVINGGNLTSATENFIKDNTSEGIRIEANAGTIGAINDNDLSGNTGFAINNLAAAFVNATCNWYGSNVPATVAGEINGNVTYIPWQTSGVDGMAGTDGFQPSAPCSAPCNLAFSISTTPAGCPSQNNGTATVMVISGGISPYTYLWSNSQTTATATGLVAGSYTVTVTDLNGCTGTAPANVTNSLAGPVHNVNTGLNYCTIQAAINDPLTLNGHVINVDAGTYPENVTLNKSLTINGAQVGVDARGRVIGVPNPMVESIISPAAGAALELFAGSSNSIIDGFAMLGNTTGTNGVIQTLTATLSGVQSKNNYLKVTSTNGQALWLNRGVTDLTVDKNDLVGGTTSSQVVFMNGPQSFAGLFFTNNNVSGTTSAAGIFVDGNRNVGTSATPRSPLVQGNLFTGLSVGINGGSRSFQDVQFLENTFTLCAFDGFQGGPKNSNFARNTFSSNGRYGLAFTSFGNLAVDRGAQGSTVQNNFFTGNTTADFRASDQGTGTHNTNTISNNSFLSTVAISNAEPNGGTDIIHAQCNWYGSTSPAVVASKIVNVAGAVTDYIPWLTSGVDGDLITPGFQPAAMCSAPCNLVLSTSTEDATCPLQNNGTATATVISGGISPYTYLWSNGQTTMTATGLVAGTYTVTVTDINGCTSTGSATVINSTSGPVHNIETGLYYCTIQSAINAPTTVNGNHIVVDAGTYNENLNINKTLTISGAQAGNCAATRSGPESIISCPKGIGINASNVTLDGFTIRDQDGATWGNSGPGFGYAILMAAPNTGTHIVNNIIKSNTVGSNISNAGASPAQVLVECNWFDSNNNAGPVSGTGIYTDEFAGGGIISNVLINNNEFSGNTSGGIDFSVSSQASAATGITISQNTFVGNLRAVFLYNTNASSFTSNDISGSTFAASGDVRIFGGVNNLMVSNNNFVAGAPHGIRITDDGGGATSSNITVTLNSFTGYSAANFAVENVSGYIGVLSAECNWWNSTSSATIAAEISGSVDDVPWLLSGADSSPAVGFQPVSACPACALVATITAPVAVFENTGGYAASVPDAGVGATYAWMVSSGMITGGAGTNSITFTAGPAPSMVISVTVTALNGCTASGNVTVNVLSACSMLDFSSPLVLSNTQATGTWYTDRYNPFGFAAQSIAPDATPNTLRESIDATDGESVRPFPFNNSFYNTQGRKYDLIDGTQAIEIDLFIPVSFGASNKRNAGMWATGFDAGDNISAFPIIEFTHDGGTPRFRVWESGTGVWVDLGVPAGFIYDQWVRLRTQLLASGEFKYTIVTAQGILQYTTTTSAPDATTDIGNVILQGYNTLAGVTYDIYWDNFKSSTILTPIITATPPAVCASSTGNMASVTTYGGATYAWTISGGMITAGAGTSNITYTAGVGAAVTLNVTVTTPACEATSSLAVPIIPLPVVSGPSTICVGYTAQYMPNTGGTWTSSNANATIDNAGLAMGISAGTVTFTFTDGTTGCSQTTPIINILPTPSAVITANMTVYQGSINNIVSVPSAGGGATYAWSVSPGSMITAGAGTNSITYTAGNAPSLTINVTVTSANGCSATGNKTVTVLVPGASTLMWVPDNVGDPSCGVKTNCCKDTLCFNLKYTPGVTGNLTTYTTGFFANCLGGLTPPIGLDSSCVMTTNNPVVFNQCMAIDSFLFNSSGNNGLVPITQGVPLILHKVCFNISTNETIQLREDAITNLSTSVDQAGGGQISEYPGYTTTTFSKPAPVVPANVIINVDCPSDTLAATVFPTVLDFCGNVVPPVLVSTINTPNPLSCEGMQVRNYSFIDCSNYAQPWSYTIKIEYEDFAITVSDGGSNVACPDLTDVVPTPPVVIDNCGNTLVPVVTFGPKPTCEGIRVYTFRYTDCEGNMHDWDYVYTVEFEPIPNPVDVTTTVNCPSQTNTIPVPPVVLDNCGHTLTPSGPVDSGPVACEGNRTYTWNYMDCEGNIENYVYTYIVDRLPFADPVDSFKTVACPALTNVVPGHPVLTDNCGTVMTPTGPVVSNPVACEGTRTYTWTYTDCTGFSQDYVYTYTVEREDFMIIPPGGAMTVACPAATNNAPALPTVTDNCGNTLIPAPPVISAQVVCEGDRTYTYTYTDCEGNTHDWVFTYTVEREDFTMPANGSSTVACPAATNTPPTLPTVVDNCGNTLAPSAPVISAQVVCEGDRTYTYTYTDCEGNTHNWVYTYTVEREDFIMPADGSSTVACPAATNTPPTLPTVVDNCGNTLAPSAPVISAQVECEGTRTYTYTYTDCEGNTHNWVYTYTVEREDFTVPANGALTVACPSATNTLPTLPTVVDNCGNVLTPSEPVISAVLTCEGTRTYTYTYTDCEGNTHNWTFTYTVEYETFPNPVDAGSTVGCPLATNTAPPLPVVTDNCGNTLIPSLPVVTPIPACEGIRTYTYTYTDCEGNNQDYVYTYTVDRPPFVLPADGGSIVNCPLATNTVPAHPTVIDACGVTLVPVGPVVSAQVNCEGIDTYRTYTWTYTDCSGLALNWVYTYTVRCFPLTLKVMLEGPYNTGTSMMDPTLNVNHVLPGQDKNLSPNLSIQLNAPYTPFGQPYNIAPWNYSGNSGATYGDPSAPGAPPMVTPYPADVVDWVLVTVRKNGILPANNYWSCAGWVHTDGQVTFPDPCGGLVLTPGDNYYVLVQHRTHLGVLSPSVATYSCGGMVINWDFTTSNSYAPIFRYGQKQVAPGVWAMHAANGEQVTSIAAISSSDRTTWRAFQNTYGYSIGDFNMSAFTESAGDETLWKTNQNRTSGIIFY